MSKTPVQNTEAEKAWLIIVSELLPTAMARTDPTLGVFVRTSMHWRRKWQPTPVFVPGESQGRRSLVGCRLWSRTEVATTEGT